MTGSLTRYQILTAATVIATLVLIAIGATVRTTGSGLGCPDWPLCHGQLLPPAEKTAIIEYTHRTAAAVVGVLVLATVFVTFRIHRSDRTMRVLAVASLPLLAFQAWIGKETVERELPPEVVTFHLATAMILLAILTVIAGYAFLGPNRARIEDAARGRALRIAVAGAVVTYIVILSGAYVVGANATDACTSWPGCIEAQVPFADGGREESIHWLHRFVVAGGLFAVAGVSYTLLQLRDAGPMLRRGAWALIALYGLQIIVGASNIWTDFSEFSRVSHLALGSAIWALMVLIAVAGHFRSGAPVDAQPSSTRDSARRGVTARV